MDKRNDYVNGPGWIRGKYSAGRLRGQGTKRGERAFYQHSRRPGRNPKSGALLVSRHCRKPACWVT
jgi:hypothetical protein